MDERDILHGARLGSEAQIDRAVEATILTAACGEPRDDAGALAAEMKRQPSPVPGIGRGFARDGEVLAFEPVSPEGAVPPANAAITRGRGRRNALETPAR